MSAEENDAAHRELFQRACERAARAEAKCEELERQVQHLLDTCVPYAEVEHRDKEIAGLKKEVATLRTSLKMVVGNILNVRT